MIRLAGDLALIFALIFAVLQSVLPLTGLKRNNPYLLACARPAAIGQCVSVLIAYLLLTIAFALNDFSIAYVAANSHPDLPLMYRLTAVWGAHEGSILLWVLMLNAWSMAYLCFSHDKQDRTLTLAVLGILSGSFLCFVLLTSNPFIPSLVAQTGMDLNPLLQDPGFVIHPPMLYIGYVGFSVAFAITLAALLRGQLDQAWANLTKRFALAAWCFLTLGITLGSWWAYRVLGWGGFWFWDPVENASLLPWLAGTALIHVLLLVEKKDTAKRWAAFLAMICFALSMLGTFLVRSGVLVSAHTFASDPARGVFLLLLLAVIMTAALTLYVMRLPMIRSRAQAPASLLSRDMALLINSALLFVAMLTVLLGTLYPLIVDALHLGSLSVGAPYFNAVMSPLVLMVMAFMGLGALSQWQAQPVREFWLEAGKRMLLSVACAMLLLWSVTHTLNGLSCLTLSLSLWVILSVVGILRLKPAMAIAHAGFAILVIGVMLSSVLNEERDVRIKPGDSAALGPYQFLFVDTQAANGSNYHGIRAAFDVLKSGRHVTSLYPEKRIYVVRDMVMTKVDIHPGIFRDLYIALGDPLDNDYWSVRLYYKPFVRWIWFGGAIMILGGALGFLSRRRNYSTHGVPL